VENKKIELDVDYIAGTIGEILAHKHTHPQKLKIIKKHDRLSFACPICGDSSKNPHLKRGHLFLNNLYFKCYNEGCHSTFTKLCKDNSIKIDPNKKFDIINYIDYSFNNYSNKDNEWFNGKLEKLIPINDLEEWFNSGEGPLTNFKPVTFGSKVYEYLLNRKIPTHLITTQFYEGLKNNGKWKEPYIIFINKIDDKVLGIQERNLKSGEFRRFKIWSFEEIYRNVYKKELDPIEAVSYNKLSYLYNILNINFEKKVTVFEGYIDSLFMKNSIGSVGINTDYNFLINNEVNIQFFFDNDNIGKKKSYEWLKKGYSVFLWELLIKDLAKNYPDPYKYKLWFNNNIKDLNKLYELVDLSNIDLNKYFSTSLADMIYITYSKFEKVKQKSTFNDIEQLKKQINNHDYNS